MSEEEKEVVTDEPIDAEIVRDEIQKRPPLIPTTIDELAAITEEGQEIIEARAQILRTLRVASIRSTSPQDWLLFRAAAPGQPDRITGYLQDAGCKRIMPLWGIDVFPVSSFEKIEANSDFAYSIRGRGVCNITKRVVEDVEGLRLSTDDFCKDLSPLLKDIRVKQAARANLDGNIVRALTGLKSVAIEEIEEIWKGTGKNINLCPRGRGYGSKAEREGFPGQSTSAPKDIAAPLCESCGKPMIFRLGGVKDGKTYPAYWKCPDYVRGGQHSAINDDEHRKRVAAREPGSEG